MQKSFQSNTQLIRIPTEAYLRLKTLSEQEHKPMSRLIVDMLDVADGKCSFLTREEAVDLKNTIEELAQKMLEEIGK